MLSDAIREARQQLASYLDGGMEVDPAGITAAVGVLDTWALEAANMEARLERVAGRRHVPLVLPAHDTKVVRFPRAGHGPGDGR